MRDWPTDEEGSQATHRPPFLLRQLSVSPHHAHLRDLSRVVIHP